MATLYDILKRLLPDIYNLENIDFEVFLGFLYRLRDAEESKSFVTNKEVEKIWSAFVISMVQVMHYSLPFKDTDKPPKMRELIDMLKGLKKQYNKVSILTTNYDLIVDKVNQFIIDEQIDPKFRSYQDLKLPPYLERCQYGGLGVGGLFKVKGRKATFAKRPKPKQWRRRKSDIQIYKLHGSFNWAYCVKCKNLHLANCVKDLYKLHESHLSYATEDGYHKYQPVFVPPISSKELRQPLKRVWERALEVLSKAHIVVFIGYSLPEQDPHVAELIFEARASSAERKEGVWNYMLIDPEPKVHERYKSLFGAAKENIIESFNPVLLRKLLDEIVS